VVCKKMRGHCWRALQRNQFRTLARNVPDFFWSSDAVRGVLGSVAEEIRSRVQSGHAHLETIAMVSAVPLGKVLHYQA
jgi:hypothetical protein